MITCCPSGPEMPRAMRRAEKSLPPPAGAVTMRTVLLGYSWPPAIPVQVAVTAISAAPARGLLLRMDPLPYPARALDDRVDVFGKHVPVRHELAGFRPHALEVCRPGWVAL